MSRFCVVTVAHNLSYGEFRLLNLDALIVAKSAVGRGKDLEAVRLLQAIEEKREHHKELF